jgi:hypothetical protein
MSANQIKFACPYFIGQTGRIFTKTRQWLYSHSRRMGPLNTQAAAITTQTAKTGFSDSISEQTLTPVESFAPGSSGVN